VFGGPRVKIRALVPPPPPLVVGVAWRKETNPQCCGVGGVPLLPRPLSAVFARLRVMLR